MIVLFATVVSISVLCGVILYDRILSTDVEARFGKVSLEPKYLSVILSDDNEHSEVIYESPGVLQKVVALLLIVATSFSVCLLLPRKVARSHETAETISVARLEFKVLEFLNSEHESVVLERPDGKVSVAMAKDNQRRQIEVYVPREISELPEEYVGSLVPGLSFQHQYYVGEYSVFQFELVQFPDDVTDTSSVLATLLVRLLGAVDDRSDEVVLTYISSDPI